MGSCKNSVSAYDNTMKNSDGSYNAIPGAKAKQVHYTALYITLSELAAEAQKMVINHQIIQDVVLIFK